MANPFAPLKGIGFLSYSMEVDGIQGGAWIRMKRIDGTRTDVFVPADVVDLGDDAAWSYVFAQVRPPEPRSEAADPPWTVIA